MGNNRRYKKVSNLKVSNDGLRDALTGIGGDKDILATGMMGFANYVTRNYTMLSRMFRSNIWVKKTCIIPAQYAVKGWRTVSDDYLKLEQKVNLKAKTTEAIQWSLLYGGSMAVFIVDDGLTPDKPLDLSKVKEDSFKRIIIVDRNKVSHLGDIDKNPISTTFGHPPLYNINIEGMNNLYHPSRVHKFVVNKLPYDESINENRFGVSSIELIYKQLINDDVFLSSLANSMKRNGMDIFGIPNLSQLIQQGKEDAIKERLRINQAAMSFLNGFVKDAGNAQGQNAETYERITASFAGFDSLDERSLARVAAAAEIQATIFLGKSPDGMNATGFSDLAIFSDRLSVIRELDIDPFLDKVDNIIVACNNIKKEPYEWINPFPKTEKDEAEIRGLNTDTIMRQQSLGLSSKLLAKNMVEYGLADKEDEKEIIDSLKLESFDIEDEENIIDDEE